MQDRLDQSGGDSGCDKAAALSETEDRVAELEVKLQQKQAALDANKARLWKAQEDKNSLQVLEHLRLVLAVFSSPVMFPKQACGLCEPLRTTQ